LKTVYDHFGLSVEAELSTRPDKYIGDLSDWDRAEAILEEQIKVFSNWKIDPGAGAFYGPKIDLRIKDSLGRDHQCGTVQLDFNLPKRFELTYVNEHDQPTNLVMIHRAIFGSIERFMAILLEHTNGHLPFWLSPRKICIIPITPEYLPYAQTVAHHFKQYQLEVDASDNTVSKKIRTAETMRYNYIFVVGFRERNTNTVNIRIHDGILGSKSIEETLTLCQNDWDKQILF
jgi:threonyl-tRNA synthetase